MEKCMCIKTFEDQFIQDANYRYDYDANRPKTKRYNVYRMDDTYAEMSETKFKTLFTTDFII